MFSRNLVSRLINRRPGSSLLPETKSIGSDRKLARLRTRKMLIEGLEERLPFAVPAMLNPTGIGGGGWFGAPSINPNQQSELWMPTDTGELFHSEDTGATWTYPAVTQIKQGYRSPVQFTSDPNVRWSVNVLGNRPSISTNGGDTWSDVTSWQRLDSEQGRASFLYTDPNSNFIVCSGMSFQGSNIEHRIYLSKDGGATWGNPTASEPWGAAIFSTTTTDKKELLVSGMFKDGNNVWISTSAGILFSNNANSPTATFNMLTVPWNSTLEGPSSMAAAKAGNTIRFVVVTNDPNDIIYNTTFNRAGLNVYMSDFNVSTQTQSAWTNISNRLPANKYPSVAAMARGSATVSGNINTIYIGGMDNRIGRTDTSTAVPSVLKSSDGGLTWRETFKIGPNSPNVATNQVGLDNLDPELDPDYVYEWAGFAYTIGISDTDVNRVIITSNWTSWMTTNGGEGGANNSVSTADWKSITADPQYLHAPGVNAPRGTTPTAGTADNSTSYNVVFLSPQNVFAAMNDQTGIYSTDGGKSWYFPKIVSGPKFSNFFDVAVDYRTNTLFAAAASSNDLYKSWRADNNWRNGKGGGLDYSTDGGKTWSLLKQWTTAGLSNPLSKVVIDPAIPGRAYAAVVNSNDGGIWRTDNLYLADGVTVNTNATWTQLSVPSRTLSAFQYKGRSYAAGTYFAHDPSDLTILDNGNNTTTLVATFGIQFDPTNDHRDPVSGVWISNDGGVTWIDRTELGSTPLSNGTDIKSIMRFYSQKLTVDPANNNTWYLAVDRLGADDLPQQYGVFKTIDRGLNWTSIFSDDGAYSVTINPVEGSPTLVDTYISTSSTGIKVSSNGGPFTNMDAEKYNDISRVIPNPYRSSEIWVATHGNGIQKGDSAIATPANLVVTGNGSSQFSMSWTSTNNPSSYIVQYTNGTVGSNGLVQWTTHSTLPGTALSASINGLATDKLYSFRLVWVGATETRYSNVVTGIKLNAPTAVVATSSAPNETNIVWQYSGTGVGTKFRIERSTDSVTWTSLGETTSIATRNFADKSVLPNTVYVYRISTIWGTGFQSSTTTNVKTMVDNGLKFYESFSYPIGLINNQGQVANNWGSAWTSIGDANSAPSIVANSLSHPNGLVTSAFGGFEFGQNAGTYAGGNVLRTTASALQSYGSTLWVSALIKPDVIVNSPNPVNKWGSLKIGNVDLRYQDSTATGNGPYQWNVRAVDTGASNAWYGQSTPIANSNVAFVVLKITYGVGGNDTVEAWINPTLGVGETFPTTGQFSTSTNVNAGGLLNSIRLEGSYFADTFVDELRIGTSFAAVDPLPSISSASDSFAYPSGVNLNGQGTVGNGWAGAWSTTGPVVTSATTLTPPVALVTSGGSITKSATGGAATRNTTFPFNSSGTLWASTVIKPDTSGTIKWGSVAIGNVDVRYWDSTGTGVYRWSLSGKDGTWFGSNWTTGPLANNASNFVVLKITYGSGNDTIQAWLNPAPGAIEPDTLAAFSEKQGVNAGGNSTTVTLNGHFDAAVGFDELRLGSSYAAVAPEAPPAAPTNLVATPVSVSQINLTWTDNAINESGFQVYQSTDGVSFNLINTIYIPNATSFNVTGLAQGTRYWFKVSAFKGAMETFAATIVNATTLTTVTLSSTASLTEGASGSITVNRVGTSGSLTVNLATPTGTAISGSDYAALPTSITIPNGASSASISLSTIDDVLAELRESVIESIVSGSGYVIGSSSQATTTIVDNDQSSVALPTSLKALWRLEEGTGTVAADTANGLADTATLTAAPTSITGKVGKGRTLNGTTQFLQASNSADLNITGTGFTAALFVKSNAATWNSTETFISKGNGYKLGGISGSKNLRFSLFINSAWTSLDYINAGDINVNWHHYAATYDGANMRIWIDGVNVASKAQTGAIASDTSALLIGKQGAAFLSASIDEVRLYNSLQTSAAISALSSQTALSVTGLTGSSTNLASYSVQSYNLAASVSQYGDQVSNFTTIPSRYLGSTWIKTAQADVTSTSATLLRFTVNQPVTLYVAFHDAIATKPTWLTSQFTDTGDDIITAKGTFSVYKLSVSAGSVWLGGAQGTAAQGMYNVFFQNIL
jgi:hypothetical protein